MPRYIIDERTPCKSDHGFASDRRQARRAHAVEGGVVGNALRRPLFSRRGSLRRSKVLGEASLAGIVDG